MTPILLSNPETKLGFLVDAIKCEVTEERNGSFELALEYPVAGQYFNDISAGRYVKAKPNDTSEPQFFKIYSVSKPINGTITVNAEHISYALSHYPVKKLDAQKTTALVAIQRVLSAANSNLDNPHKFSVVSSDIDTLTNFGAELCSARAALGGIEGSILDCYGGEYEFDNYKIKLHKNRGKDNKVAIRYGKNMTDMKLLVSTENSYTGIFPYVYDDDKLITLTEGTIHVTNSSGIEERILLMDFSSYFESGEEKNATNLKTHVDKYLEDNDINAVEGSMTVSMIDLSKTANAEFAALETVSLCDTVKVVNTLMDVTLSMKVIKTVYDSISERYKSLELGTPSGSFADVIKQTNRTANKALEKATEASKLEQEFQNELDEMTKAITGASGGHVVLNPSKNPQELLILIDSDKIETATKLYRFNSAGLAYSSNGYNGPYSAGFLGADGKLIINNVTARSISADLIRAGTIMSVDGKMTINLDSGEITNKSKDEKLNTKLAAGYLQLFKGNEIPATIGVTEDSDIAIGAMKKESSGKFRSVNLYLINGCLYTNYAGYNQYAAIEHRRTTNYGGAEVEYPAFMKLGIGASGTAPSISCELRLDDRTSTIPAARFDVFRSTKTAKNENGEWVLRGYNDVNISFFHRDTNSSGGYVSKKHTLRMSSSGYDFLDGQILVDDVCFVSERGDNSFAKAWTSLKGKIEKIESNIKTLESNIETLMKSL